MLQEVFSFLQKRLVEYIAPEGPEEEAVNFIDLNSDPPAFKAKVNLLFVNLEEENQARGADRYIQVNSSGQKLKVQPALALNIYVLVAVKPRGGESSLRDYNYLNALKHLGDVLKCFQATPVFRREIYPDMPADVEYLKMEIHPLNHGQQNEIWSSLKTAYLPSVCYRVKMLTFQSEPSGSGTEVGEVTRQTHGV